MRRTSHGGSGTVHWQIAQAELLKGHVRCVSSAPKVPDRRGPSRFRGTQPTRCPHITEAGLFLQFQVSSVQRRKSHGPRVPQNLEPIKKKNSWSLWTPESNVCIRPTDVCVVHIRQETSECVKIRHIRLHTSAYVEFFPITHSGFVMYSL